MPDVSLTGPLRQQLYDALIAAFPSWGSLARLMSFGLNVPLGTIAAEANPLDDAVYRIMVWAEARSKVALLVDTARAFNPDNDLLTVVSSDLSIGSLREQTGRLQSMIDPSHDITPLAIFNGQLGKIEYQVCQIEYLVPGGRQRGTGFLTSSDTVLTCHHVIDKVIDGSALPGDVIVRFDYKLLPPGIPVRAVREIRLAASKWLLDASEPDSTDRSGAELPLPAADKLDYALLRLSEPVGNQPIASVPGNPKRGWITATGNANVNASDMLFIMQHPAGQALGLAFEGPGVKSVNANRTRFRHFVNTKSGSSGAPCFDRDLNLVGLHHSGDTNDHPTWNQAVTIGPIRDAIHANGHTTVLT